LIEEAHQAKWPIRYVLFSDGISQRGSKLVADLTEKGVSVEQVSADLMQALSETETSQGILAILEEVRIPLQDKLDFILIPDRIRDPGNLGTLLRTADAAGVDAILIPPETADAYSPKVTRSGMGAHFRLPIHNLDWERIEQISKSAGLQVFLAQMGGLSYWQTDLNQPIALIVGGEAEGASEPAHRLASQSIGIPMAHATESLNAAVAGSLLMYEVVRQRLKQKGGNAN